EIAGGEKSGLTWLWDVISGLPNNAVQTANTGTIALSSDSKWLAAGQIVGIQVWDSAHGKYRALQTVTGISDPNPLGMIQALAFNPDGNLLVSGGTGSAAIVLWDTGSWNAKTVVAPGNSSSSGMVQDVAFSPDNKLLAYRTTKG